MSETSRLSKLESQYRKSAENGKSARAVVIAGLLKLVNARLERASFFDTAYHDLQRLNITGTGLLLLKQGGALGGWEEKAEAFSRGHARSSANLYERLEHLQALTSNPARRFTQDEVPTHAWIGALFAHVHEMVLPSQMTAFSMEQPILPTIEASMPTTLHGIIDHTAPITDGSAEETHAFFSGLTIEQLRSTILSGLVVAETKLPWMTLQNDVPELVLEMHDYAMALAKNVIRGALTNGDAWIFVILVMDPNGDGGKYWRSETICILSGMPMVITPPRPDAIAGILAHWLNYSFEDIGDGDHWFEAVQCLG